VAFQETASDMNVIVSLCSGQCRNFVYSLFKYKETCKASEK